MVGSRQLRLRVGVIGLGRLWETRHKPSLTRLVDQFRVTAVYDQVHRRAEIEAAHLGCAACEGLTALVERPDVDVIYLLSRQWFGLHPVAMACALGKPVYCAWPLADDLAELEALAGLVGPTPCVFMPELARRFYPATRRLQELLAGELGPPRLIVGHSRLYGFDRYATPGPTTQLAPAPLLVDPGAFLLDWCGHVFQAAPESVRGFQAQALPAPSLLPPPASDGASSDFECFVASYPRGATAHVCFSRYARDRWGEASRFLPAPGFQIFAERGAAFLEMPERIQWSTATTVRDERLPLEPTIGDVLNDQFHRLVRGEETNAPDIRDALALARLVHDIRAGHSAGPSASRTP